jgi:hypothetical protein
MSPTEQRERAIEALFHDFAKGLTLARQVSDPWFRCQALAWASRFVPENDCVPIAKEAMDAARSDTDPFKVVGASCWPVRALIERGFTKHAIEAVSTVLTVANQIEQPESMAEVLFLLFNAVDPLPTDAKQIVLQALTEACVKSNGWRAKRALRETASILARDDPKSAERFVSAIPEGTAKRQASRRRANRETGVVRAFFWDQKAGT